MHRPKRWNISATDERAAELAGRLKTSPLLAQILINRGICEPDECQEFLRPSPKGLADPSLIPNLKVAAERIARAIRDKEKIVIYGDYDVDGITATSILWHAIRVLGGEVDYYIPHRIDEGYGLNAEALAQICDEGARVIVSVDCGITAVEQVKAACARGVDVIITDHHEWHCETDEAGSENREARRPILPACYTIVHPRLPGSTYPNPHLCGAGVAFKLAWGVGLALSGSERVSPEFRAFLVE